MHGPRLREPGKQRGTKVYLLAFLDDASRQVPFAASAGRACLPVGRACHVGRQTAMDCRVSTGSSVKGAPLLGCGGK